MAILKNKDIDRMTEKDRNEKIKDLNMELIKEKVSSTKGGKLKTKEIKRTIARLHTFNRLNRDSTSQKTDRVSKPQIWKRNPKRRNIKPNLSNKKSVTK
ncbi:50S ribosomal protein L29 [Candidatus Pacearchaeota archaeon]|nr:50S ribosomal protein L29 [Candidatus Pacearchaeota archaeon]